MSFGSFEQSIESSSPVELYAFTYSDTTYFYTSTEANVTIGSTTYVSTQISRAEIQESSEVGKTNMVITAPDQFPISVLFESGPPESIVTVQILRAQLGALDTGDVEVIWSGRILTVGFPNLRSEITCEQVFTSLRAAGIHRIFTINCPFALYGPECKVAAGGFGTTCPDTVQSGTTLSSSELNTQPTGWFSGGYMTWAPSAGVMVTRGIKVSVNNGTAPGTIEIPYAIPNFPEGGVTITAYAGCDHSLNTCIVKFNNLVNNGSFPGMTLKNPWGSVSIF